MMKRDLVITIDPEDFHHIYVFDRSISSESPIIEFNHVIINIDVLRMSEWDHLLCLEKTEFDIERYIDTNQLKPNQFVKFKTGVLSHEHFMNYFKSLYNVPEVVTLNNNQPFTKLVGSHIYYNKGNHVNSICYRIVYMDIKPELFELHRRSYLRNLNKVLFEEDILVALLYTDPSNLPVKK